MRATLFFMIRMELKEPVTSAEHEVECVSSADLRRKNRFRDRLAQQQRELQFQLDPIQCSSASFFTSLHYSLPFLLALT